MRSKATDYKLQSAGIVAVGLKEDIISSAKMQIVVVDLHRCNGNNYHKAGL